MSSAPAQIAVVPSANGNIVTSPSAQIQKEYLEEPLGRQNSLGNRGRGGVKGKGLTRSHAMREATSPPRTPTPRSDQNSSLPPLATSGNHSPSTPESINDSSNITKLHSQPTSLTQSSIETPAVIVTTQHQQQQQHHQQQIQQAHSNIVIYSSNDNSTSSGSVICNDVDFPKLTPPKSSKGARIRDNGNNNINNNHINNNCGGGVCGIANGNGSGGMAINVVVDNNKSNNDHKIVHHQQQPHSTSIGDSTNYYSSCKKVVNESSNTKSNNHNNNINSNGQNNSNINNNQIISASTNASNRNNPNLNNNNENYGSTSNANINVSISQLNPQASPYINTPVSSPMTTSPFDRENRCQRNESQNSNNSGSYSQEENQNCCMENSNEKSDRLNKKHRNGLNSKDSSTEQFTDQSGIDLVQFFKETLNKSLKDRSTLMEIEKDLIELAHDKSQKELRFQPMSSYNRMLIHRVAAFFGMEHNVDKATQQCVIVAPTKATRIPDIRFKQLVRDEPRKSILKRDTHSFDDARQGGYLGVDRGVLDRKAKSFEEREEEYEKARRRIFRGRESADMMEEQTWHWANDSNNSVAPLSGSGLSPSSGSNSGNESLRVRQNNKLLKPIERQDSRSSNSKNQSFTGYTGPPSNNPSPHMSNLTRGDSLNSNKNSGQRIFSKQDSSVSNTQSWRLSPSSSGSIYHFDPSNIPPNQTIAPGIYNNTTNNINRKNKNEKQRKVSENYSNSIHSPSVLLHGVASTDSVNTINNNNTKSTSTLTENISLDGGTTSIDNVSEVSCRTIVNTSSGCCSNINQQTSSENETNEEIDDGDNLSGHQEDEVSIHHEIDDIEEELTNTNYEGNEKSTLKVEENCTNLQEKPKFINQATSPNIPSPEPEYNETTSIITSTSEIGKSSTKSANSDNQTSVNINNVSAISTSSTTLADTKKDEPKSITSNVSVMSYATGYQTIDGTTVFQPQYSTTYQQMPDGGVYAVPQQMVYTAYPQPIDSNEMQGYFVYDPTTAARDGTTLVQTPVYQPGSGTTVVPVATYPPTPFGSAPIYQQQVVYAAEQFPNAVAATSATAAGQVQQYPITYPVGYSYPYNGYWGQTMTYYVPQPPLANAVSSSLIQPQPLSIVTPGTSATTPAVNIGSSINALNSTNHLSTASGKRTSPGQQTQSQCHSQHHSHSTQHQSQQHLSQHHPQPSQTHHQPLHSQSQSHQQLQQQPHQHQNITGQSSQSTPPGNTGYPFSTTATATGMPVAITGDPNAPTMYAIPQSAVFPNTLLSYGHPAQAQFVPTTQAPPTTPGVITHLPSQSQTVINPMIAQSAGGGPHGSLLPPQHISFDQSGAISVQPPHANSTNNNSGNHTNRSCTPQSTPSTPASANLPHGNHHHHSAHRNNPPLFATPPTLPNGFTSQLSSNLYQPNFLESHSGQQQFNQAQTNSAASNSSLSSSTYEKKTSYSNTKKNNSINNNSNNLNNSGSGGYNNSSSINRHNTYSNNIPNNQRKIHENISNSINSYSNTNTTISTSNSNSNNNNRQIYNSNQSNSKRIDKNQTSATIANAGANNTVGVQNNLGNITNPNASSSTGSSVISNNLNGAQMNLDTKPRPGGIRSKPGNIDYKRNCSQRNTPSTNSIESNNNSPNSIASNLNNHNTNLGCGSGGGIPTTPIIMTAVTAATPADHHHHHHPVHSQTTHQHQPQQQHQQTMYMTRGTHIPPMHPPSAAAIAAATAAAVSDVAAAAATHQPLIGAYNHHQVAPGSIYYKYGQAYFAHPSVATLPNNRRSPPSEIRPSLTPIYSTVNMMLPAPRQLQPRHPNPNYKGNKPSR